MKWSINLGSILGVRFRVHLTFLLLLAFIAYVGYVDNGGLVGAAGGVLFMCALFFCVTVHEMSHSLMAMRFGVQVESIMLLPIGGVAQMRSIPEDALQELLISAVGPLTSVGIFAVMAIVLRPTTHEILAVEPFTLQPRLFLTSLMSVNLLLGIFNLIPAFPTDGGRLFRGLLALAMDFDTATRIAVTVGQIFAVLLVFVGVLYSLWLVLIGFFIFLGASSEGQRIKLRRALREARVRDVMATMYRVMSPEEPLITAYQDVIRGAQDDFPVAGDGQYLGMVPRSAVLAAARDHRLDLLAGQRAVVGLPPVDPGEDLYAVYRRMVEERYTVLPVVAEGRMVGLISQDGISRYFSLQQATRR